MTERWLPIPGYEGAYDVSSLGRFRSYVKTSGACRDEPVIIKTCVCPATGYVQVQLHSKTQLAHRMVCAAFHGPCPPGMECSHANDDRLDNREGNLEWTTKLKNEATKDAHGNRPLGEEVPTAVITEEIVRQLRSAYSGQRGDIRRLSEEFGLEKTCVRRVVRNIYWRHVR